MSNTTSAATTQIVPEREWDEPARIEAAAAAIAKSRSGFIGAAKLDNILDLLAPHVREFILADAKAALEAVGRFDTLRKLEPVPGAPDQHGEKHYATLDAMTARGGSFVVAIAEAWRHADPQNHARLYEAFGHYYREYAGGGS